MKQIMTIVLVLAVMGYTVLNYMAGKMNMGTFLVYMVILGLPLINIINILIQQRRNKD